jgi:hypothetical protein
MARNVEKKTSKKRTLPREFKFLWGLNKVLNGRGLAAKKGEFNGLKMPMMVWSERENLSPKRPEMKD